MSGAPCRDCFSGTVHLGNPVGTIETIHGLQVYVAKPDAGVTPKGIILYLPDAFGWDFTNNRILADHYAKRGGFIVYLPDLMGGRSLSISVLKLTEKLMAPASWLTTLFLKPWYLIKVLTAALPWLYLVRKSVVKPRLFSFLQALRTSPPPFPTDDLKIGAAGFCWGGYWVVNLCADAPSTRIVRHSSQKTTGIQPLIDCGFTAHPSRLNVPRDIEAVTLPLSIAVGNDDMALKAPLILKTKEILEVKKKGDHEVVIMPGAKHGFAVRTNPEDKVQMEFAEQAEEQAVSWFSKWFA